MVLLTKASLREETVGTGLVLALAFGDGTAGEFHSLAHSGSGGDPREHSCHDVTKRFED